MNTNTIESFNLETIEVNLLPELQGWEEKQLQIVNDNPFIEITDNATFQEAKKNRTALVSARTDVQNQEKTIASKIKSFRDKVKEASAKLISITQPHEEKQQEEVRRYEAIKEQQRIEKERQEQERKDLILSQISSIYEGWKFKISSLTFDQLESFTNEFNLSLENQDVTLFEEFGLQYAENVNLLKSQITERSTYLTEQENTRVEREALAKEKEAFEKQQSEAKAKAEKANQERIAQEKEARDKREAEQKKIDKEREELQKEKDRIAKEEKAKQDALEAERKSKELKLQAKEKAKREEALKPDVQKLKTVIDSIGIHEEKPELKDSVTQLFFTKITTEIESLKSELSTELNTLK